ncbi:DUF397 domain-containing protein [Amycolatopsis circi]|uniref:DUF397 domain-containing protein n=1 Tax=Amycolatopsis circi TaxID=871959 RepID=UPI000E248A03|nr:DUF397 domain-containing protein [Amycolatopsis circi]
MSSYDPNTVSSALDDTAWLRPSACGGNGGDCVEVNLSDPDLVAVRDSKIGRSPALVFDNQEWAAFAGALREGQFDR